jgi:hypothetical protein
MFNVPHIMKPPPFLLFAALLFWGWQSGFLIVGVLMGMILESARVLNFRWELDDADFSRIWFFCLLLTVALAGFVFTMNGEGGGFGGWLHGNFVRNAAGSSVQTTTRFLRWLPMTYFALIAAQTFNLRSSVPLTAISLVLRWRQRKGRHVSSGQYLDMAYPYFILCVFSAGIHTNEGTQSYFFGQCFLIAWALWSVRSRRFRAPVWVAAFLLVVGLGVAGGFGIRAAQLAIQNFNAQWMARLFSQQTDPLQSMTSMGRIGELKLSAKIVIWLEPRVTGQPPEYLREASYRSYQALKETWYDGGPLNDFELLHAEPDNTSWDLLSGKNNSAAVNIACYLNGWSRELEAPEGLLPLPSGCARLENVPANTSLKRNRNGAVLAAGNGLLIFDAFYGRGTTMDAPPDVDTTNRLDLEVPANEAPALRQVLAEMKLAKDADETQKLQSIRKFFYDHFTYSIWQGPDKLATADATPLTKFLLTSRRGHCEYFATATVLLLRQLGIPARYAVGYYVHEPRGSGYIVRERDAHAWCLVWNGKTWEDFDITPPSWVGIESRRTAFGEWFADLRSWLGFQFAKFRWGQAHFQQYILWSLVPVLVVLLYHILFRRRGRRRRVDTKKKSAVPANWPGLDSEFYQLEKKLAARGVPRQTGEPLADWLERALTEPAVASLRPTLLELLRLHYRHRFDPPGLDADERKMLSEKVKSALTELSRR